MDKNPKNRVNTGNFKEKRHLSLCTNKTTSFSLRIFKIKKMFIFSKEILFKNERRRRKVLFEGRKNENSAKRYENGHYCKTGEKSECRPLGRYEKVGFLARNQFVFFLYIYMCLYAPEILSLPVAFSLRPVIVSKKHRVNGGYP